MPDVGVLSLQIQDNSGKAAEGLDRLATALNRVRQAVGGGLKLGPIANQIKKLNDAVAKAIPEQSLASLERFANAIEKINMAGGIKLDGMKNAAELKAPEVPAKQIKEQIEEAAADGFRSMQSRMEESKEQIAETAKESSSAIREGLSTDETQKNPVFDADFYEKKIAEMTEGLEKAQTKLDSLREKSGTASFVEAQKTVSAYSDEIARLTRNYEDMLKYQGKSKEQLEEMRRAQSQAAWAETEKAFENMRKKQEEGAAEFSKVEQTVEEAREAFKDSDNFMKESVAHKYGMSVEEMFPSEEMNAAAESAQGLSGSIQQLGSSTEPMAGGFGKATESLKGFVQRGLENLKSGISGVLAPLSGLLAQFERVARYRALRAVLKQITEGFKEGTENYYRYSQAIGGGFATSMDSAASALLQMKNSIGAAAAPLIQSLIPYLQMAVSWFVSLINSVNQFLALLRGQATWSKATEQSAKAFDDVKKSAGGAAKAVKDLLADWDELNIIQSETGGGGGSGGSTKKQQDYLGMFEEVGEFDKDIKALVDNIKKRFGSVLGLVKKIAAVILGWKVGAAFSGVLGTLGSLIAAGGIIDLVFRISQTLTDTYLDTGNAGWLVGDVLTTIIGGVLAQKVLTKVLGGQVAKIAIPITFAVSALATIKSLIEKTDVSALDERSILAAITAGLEGGTAAGFLYHLAGIGLAGSIGGGIGMAIATFGVAIGLKAIAQVAEDGKITSETLGADFLAASAVGAGLAITELALGGTIVSALTLAGGGALLTLAALVAIQAIVAEANRSTIEWGNYDATAEEIKAFVESTVFDGAKPKVKLSLANATVDKLGQSKEELEASMSEVLGELHVVKIGLTSSADSDLEAKVKDLIKKYNTVGRQNQEALELSFSLVPKVGGSTEKAKEIAKNSKERWSSLDGIMQGLAADLTSAFNIAYDEKLDEATRASAQASIEKISKMMTEVADAISSGQAKAKVAMNLRKGLEDLSKGSMDELIAEYGRQRDALVEELTKTSTDAAEGLLAQQYAYEKLAEYALRDAGGDATDATYQEYLQKAQQAADDYKARVDTIAEDAKAEADRTLANTEGVEKIRKALLGKTFADITTPFSGASLGESLLARAGIGDPKIFSDYFSGLIENGSTEEAKQEIKDSLWSLLYEAVGGENIGTYLDAIEKGILRYGDFFSKELIDTMAEAMGIPDTGEVREAWDKMVSEILGIGEEESRGTEGISMDVPITFNPVYDVETPEGEFDVETDTEGLDITGRKIWKTSQLSARSGMSDVRYADNSGGGDTAIAVTLNSEEQKGNIQSGVQTGTSQILEVLRAISTTATAINQKNFTVNITPTTLMGRVVSGAAGALSAVTGNIP